MGFYKNVNKGIRGKMGHTKLKHKYTLPGIIIDPISEIENKIDVYKFTNLIKEFLLSRSLSRIYFVLKLRYGLENTKPHTLDECGEIMGVSRERIRQLEAKGLRSLRNYRVRKKLEDFLGYLK
jgi:DNA-directed RNA polymerase sigma subunit (sigma70/sigma32)